MSIILAARRDSLQLSAHAHAMAQMVIRQMPTCIISMMTNVRNTRLHPVLPVVSSACTFSFADSSAV